jgi:hypothetical protein
VHAAIVLAPDSNERSIHVEPAQSDMMDAALHLRRCVPHPLLELTIVDALPTAAPALVEFVCELKHRLHAACKLPQVGPLL